MAQEPLVLDDWGYFLIGVSWLFVVISFVVCAYATYVSFVYYKEKLANKDSAKNRIILIVLTLTTMWLFTAINICDSVGLPHWFANKDQQYEDWDEWWFNWEHSAASYLMWNVFWAVSKIMLYIVYIARVYSVFNGTKYAVTPLWYYVFAVLLLMQFTLLCLWCYYYNISWYCCEIWDEDQYEILTGLAWGILALDLVISLSVVYLFLYSMRNLLEGVRSQSLKMNAAAPGGLGSTTEQSAVGSTTATQDVNGGQANETGSARTTWEARERSMVKTATKLFVLAMISLGSSMFYQFIFGIAISEEFSGSHTHTAFYYFTFTWNVDSTLNIICLYLSLQFAKNHYNAICKCDGCCFNFIQKMTGNSGIETPQGDEQDVL